MTIKIVDIGPDASVVKKIICKHCGATLEYCPIDVEIKSDSDLDVTSWINCPNCGKIIRVEMSNQIDNVCDICLGKKETLTGKPCICKDGSLLGLLVGLRIELFVLGQELVAANDKIAAQKPQENSDFRDYCQNPYGFGGHRQ